MNLVLNNINNFLAGQEKVVKKVGGYIVLCQDFNQLLLKSGYLVLKKLKMLGQVEFNG